MCMYVYTIYEGGQMVIQVNNTIKIESMITLKPVCHICVCLCGN